LKLTGHLDPTQENKEKHTPKKKVTDNFLPNITNKMSIG